MKITKSLPSFLEDEKGSSSILVIIMMVVLMVFGLAVLTTSLSNLRLSEKKRDWLQDYYNLEIEVDKKIATIDALLIKAEIDTEIAISEGSYIDDYMLDAPLNDWSYSTISKLVYKELSTEALLAYIANDPSASLTINDMDMDDLLMGAEISPSLLTFDTSLANLEYSKHITVTMAIEPRSSNNLDDSNKLLQRFTIKNYTQWQDPFEYEDALDFDDPFDNEVNSEDSNPFSDTNNEKNANPFTEID